MNLLPAALFLVPVLALASAPRLETRQEPLAMGSRLRISQVAGDIAVEGWDKPEVAITAEFQDGAFDTKMVLEVRHVADGMEVEVKRRERGYLLLNFHKSPLCNLRLMVPHKLVMSARTVDGRIQLKNLEGFADLETVDGDIQVEDVRGEVRVHSTDGKLQARNLQARLKGSTVDGNINLDRVAGGVDLSTVDGKITAQDLDGWGEGINLSTVDGTIAVRLGEAKGNLEARTVDGAIHASNPGLVLDESRKNVLKGHIPGRVQRIRLKTVDGRIQID